MYGVLLATAAGNAVADELAYVGAYRTSPPVATAPTAPRALLATIEGFLVLNADRPLDPAGPLLDDSYPRLALDRISARLQEPTVTQSPLLRVSVSPEATVRDGLGFDVAVPDFGNFHLNLYKRKNPRTLGKRWQMSLADAEPAERTWSLGGSLELVRTVDGVRQVAFVPELLVDLDALTGKSLGFTASIKYGHWRSIGEKQALEDEVPQLSFRWSL